MRRIFILLWIAILSAQLHAASTNDTYILTLSDIHFDPFAYCYNKVPCPIINKLQQADVKSWANVLQNLNQQMPQFKEDTNYTLLNSSLENMKRVTQFQKPSYVLVLGDYLGHDYRRKFIKFSANKSKAAYRAFVYKTFQFISLQLKQVFPQSEIYNVVGNNDGYQGNYVSDPRGVFFYDIGKLWSGMLNSKNRAQMQKQFVIGGYYAIDLQPNLRLIILNTNLFSYNARGNNLDAAATNELTWLNQQLENAKVNNQKVIIGLHIPPGINLFASAYLPPLNVLNLWKPDYSEAYNNIINNYAMQIVGIFSGHLHADWYQAMHIDSQAIPLAGTPSLSPIYGTNPGFKIYTFSEADNKLTSFTTHQYSISLKRMSLIQSSFNISVNLRCETNENVTTKMNWVAYYQCYILK